MKRSTWMLAAVAAVSATGGAAMADTYFDNAYYAVSSGGGFYISNSSLFKSFAQSVHASPTDDVVLATNAGGYADAGIVLAFDGSLKLGNLSSLSVTSAGVPLSVNLWLDTGNDGKFFAFSGPGNTGTFTGLAGDSYLGTNIGTGSSLVNGSSSFYGFAGDGAGGTYTLAQLQAGAVSGIDANTRVALWIGMVGTGNGGADITDAEVATISGAQTAVPLPAAAWGGMTLLGGLVFVGGLKRVRRQEA